MNLFSLQKKGIGFVAMGGMKNLVYLICFYSNNRLAVILRHRQLFQLKRDTWTNSDLLTNPLWYDNVWCQSRFWQL